MPTFRFLVSGRVQGVGYRYFAMKEADRHGVSGFARNLPDGRVEVVGEGAAEALSAFAESLARGPSFAAVDHVDKAEIAPRGDSGFHIR